jgi:hypothetical protein
MFVVAVAKIYIIIKLLHDCRNVLMQFNNKAITDYCNIAIMEYCKLVDSAIVELCPWFCRVRALAFGLWLLYFGRKDKTKAI